MELFVGMIGGVVLFYVVLYLINLDIWKCEIAKYEELTRERLKQAELGQVVHIPVSSPLSEKPRFRDSFTWIME